MRQMPPVILEEDRQKLIEAIETEALAQEVLWLWPMSNESQPPVGQIGGWPSLPDDTAWPISPKTEEPIHFLFQIDLARLSECNNPKRKLLPSKGLLLVFAGLTFRYIDGVTGNCPGLVNLIYVPEGKLGDDGRRPPANLPSPFTAPDAFMPLVGIDIEAPVDGSIPQCPMGAVVVPELLSPQPQSSILDSKSLNRCYDAIKNSLADSEAEHLKHARLLREGRSEPLSEFNVIRMLNGGVSYENAPDLPKSMNDPVHLFTFQLPPRSGVFAGDPLLDILIEASALDDLRLETVTANVDVS